MGVETYKRNSNEKYHLYRSVFVPCEQLVSPTQTLRYERERNHCEQPSAFPSIMRERHARDINVINLTSLPLVSREKYGACRARVRVYPATSRSVCRTPVGFTKRLNANFSPKTPTKERPRTSSKYCLVWGINLKPNESFYALSRAGLLISLNTGLQKSLVRSVASP